MAKLHKVYSATHWIVYEGCTPTLDVELYHLPDNRESKPLDEAWYWSVAEIGEPESKPYADGWTRTRAESMALIKAKVEEFMA